MSEVPLHSVVTTGTFRVVNSEGGKGSCLSGSLTAKRWRVQRMRGAQLQGYLTQKKHPTPRTLQYDFS